MKHSEQLLPGFRKVPKTGVIFVMSEAAKLGFNEQRELWANLGQGAPETGLLEGAPERIESICFSTDDHEYAPVSGLPELRDLVAKLYNERYRSDKKSKYTRENVAICAGGRLALTRLVSTLGKANIGHVIPDYTAYEELLDSFGGFVPIPILTKASNGFSLDAKKIEEEILGRGLSAILLSNPCNPTGSIIQGEELTKAVEICRKHACTLILDEFYSHYLYNSKDLSLSAAKEVKDVNKDPVVVFDGLTKNWRYPGFRVSWTVGPASIIEAISSAGSFIDGGCSRVMQIAACDLLDKETADKEAKALQTTFSKKREIMISGLQELGIKISKEPEGGFYCWGSLENLPNSINTGVSLLEKALQKKVVIVPGVFFDINPGQRRPERESRFKHYARFSFGPPIEEIERGLKNLKALVKEESK